MEHPNQQPVSGFHLHVSNRLESLLENLGEIASAPLSSPFVPEVIVVQSSGMARWLTQELAIRLGVWANSQFLFPNAAVEEIFDRAGLGRLPEKLFTPEVMVWRILAILDNFLEKPEFTSLSGYLGESNDLLKKFQLCQQIARIFDQYMVYRPEMLLEWQQGHCSDWQGQLWQALVIGHSREHRTAMQQAFLERAKQGKLLARQFPSRISIFGMPTLPLFHLEVFFALSRYIQIHLFMVNPSQEYWGDVVSPKMVAKIRARGQSSRSSRSADYFEVGNPLLSSMGRLGQRFLEMLLDRNSYQDHSHYKDPGQKTLLTSIQSDILNLRDPISQGIRRSLSTEDMSLRIHSCHGPMREIEVLQDNLLCLLDQIPDLSPNEILVLTPNIAAYVPFINAVFGGESLQEKRIPFSIADHSTMAESPVIQALMEILKLAGSRMDVDSVLDLLVRPIVYRRFDLSSENLESIFRWVKSTRIRWGIDGAHRSRFGVPPFENNSWSAGIKRILLGYAMSEQGQSSFQGVFPQDEIEGSGVQAVGGFVEFINQLFDTVNTLESSWTLSEWSQLLRSIVDQFLVVEEETERDLQFFHTLCQEMGAIQPLSSFSDPVGLTTILHHLGQCFQQVRSSREFLTGGVTFSAMLPMRSIPFRVIALVGINDGIFPRNERPLSFDLMVQSPRQGDPSARDEDRMLFLETLLSAREHLVISYAGQSIRDNQLLAPSVLLTELMDYVCQAFEVEGRGYSIQDQILVRHRLQGYSASYFSGKDRLFSYSRENLEALEASLNRVQANPARLLNTIEEPSEEWRVVDLDEMKRFFRRPVEYFFRKRVGIFLEGRPVMLARCEPFVVNALDEYQLKQELLAAWLEGKDLDTYRESILARGMLPPGKMGDQWFYQLVAKVECFGKTLRPHIKDNPLDSLAVDLELGPFFLRGGLDGLWPQYLVRYRCAKLTSKDRMEMWIDHLVMNCVRTIESPRQSILAGSDKVVTYRPVQDCYRRLENLLAYYWTGICQPLPLLLETSYAYAKRISHGAGREEAIKHARISWASSRQRYGEARNPYHDLAYRSINPLDERFESIALEIFTPLLDHEDEVG